MPEQSSAASLSAFSYLAIVSFCLSIALDRCNKLFRSASSSSFSSHAMSIHLLSIVCLIKQDVANVFRCVNRSSDVTHLHLIVEEPTLVTILCDSTYIRLDVFHRIDRLLHPLERLYVQLSTFLIFHQSHILKANLLAAKAFQSYRLTISCIALVHPQSEQAYLIRSVILTLSSIPPRTGHIHFPHNTYATIVSYHVHAPTLLCGR